VYILGDCISDLTAERNKKFHLFFSGIKKVRYWSKVVNKSSRIEIVRDILANVTEA